MQVGYICPVFIRALILILFVSWIVPNVLNAQEIFPVNGVHNPEHITYALTNARIYESGHTFYENGTLLVRDGKVLACGKDIDIPRNAVVLDLQGKYIYPAFVELNASYGFEPPAKKHSGFPARPQYDSDKKGPFYWNSAVHPEEPAVERFRPDKKAAKEWQQAGFGMMLTHPHDGIVRGTAVLVNLHPDNAAKAVVVPEAAACYSFNKGSSSQLYPTSLMGAIALIRQYFYDVQWYASGTYDYVNVSLEAGVKQQNLPAIFETKNCLNGIRAAAIAKEFDKSFVLIGGGDEYKRIDEVKATGMPWVLPLDFPKAIDVSDPLDALYVSLEDMLHWEQAPANPATLAAFDIPFALTASRNKSGKEFVNNLRKAVRYGLPVSRAIDALTLQPAILLGRENLTGSLTKGKLANFFISDTDFFNENASVLESWIEGERYIFKDATAPDPEGKYNFNIGGVLYTLAIKKSGKGYTAYTSLGGSEDAPQKGTCKAENELITLTFKKGNSKNPGPLRLTGKINFRHTIIDGKAIDGNGNWVNWTAIRQKETAKKDSVQTDSLPETGPVLHPARAFGDTLLPERKDYFIDNATIWTCDSTGKFRGDVLVRNGKIAAVGKNLTKPDGVEIIDGKGMHLTPGIIDEHSHIAISGGVNEAGQAISSEVRIGDVVNPDDINIYRQLAGGVTTAQLLHGSANPIGGQSAIVKLKWGRNADSMKVKEAPGFIKFALGENVKQSNSPPSYNIRFPQTRMGVEQVYIDAFTRARAYEKTWQRYDSIVAHSSKRALKKNPPPVPRRDLELDALVEILNSDRFITCHSYVQSEINMLMHVADTFGFRVNTFTHILEGYKLADKLKAHEAFASSFADWWAYKYEVKEAIPHNAAILTKQGVITAINSDDAEMGRRLNQEAAKTVKYGGLTEEEALKTVTINPATMLHIDDRTGSISVGKDADLVLWNGHPLAVSSHPVLTMIEGTVYYSTERDNHLDALIRTERNRLIKKMLEAIKKGEPYKKAEVKKTKLYHCDTFETETDF